jgi:hypothetical protein
MISSEAESEGESEVCLCEEGVSSLSLRPQAQAQATPELRTRNESLVSLLRQLGEGGASVQDLSRLVMKEVRSKSKVILDFHVLSEE